MKRLIYSIALMAMAAPFVANAQEFDDIYYNPKKDKTVNQTTTKKQSNYIKDFSSIDVDQYNRRGQYYASPIDTIGAKAENDEDFVYTQQIQKYYNPTIVLDNADVLADVLNNSYGNVEIVFNNGIPSFSPYYYSYGWPYYNSYYGWNSWTWGPSWSWSWNWGPSWAWGPSWSWNWNWNWGPSWAWGPSWSWGWGWNNPWNWGHGPGWGHGPAWGPGRPYADYRPGGRLPNRPGSNWASNTRPGGNYNGGHSAAGGGYRPTNSGVNNRPNNSVFGGSATNHHRTYGTANGNTGTHSTNAGNSQNNGSNRNSYTVNSNGHRTYNNSSTLNNNSNNSNNNHRQTNNSYNNNSNRNNNYNYNSNSNRGGSFGSGSSHRSSGGFGGGGRSSGGGGARGTHR